MPEGDITGRNKPAASSKGGRADQLGLKGTSASIPLTTVFRLASCSGRRCAGGDSTLGWRREVRAKRRGDAVSRSARREEAEILTIPAEQERETRVVDVDLGPLQGLGFGIVDLVVVRDLANLLRAAGQSDHARVKQSDVALELGGRVLLRIDSDEQRLRTASPAAPS